MNGCIWIVLCCIGWTFVEWSHQAPYQDDEFLYSNDLNQMRPYDDQWNVGAEDNTTVEIDVTFEQVLNICKIKEQIDDEDIEILFDNVLPTTQRERCFIACWLERFHVMANGKFRREQYIKLTNYQQDENVEQRTKVLRAIFNDCKDIDRCRPERCELAYRIMKCINDGAIKRKIDPTDL